MASGENLPEEVMIEILSRLRVESLLRFKSVRKSWYALINDPNFVRKHFSNSLHHNHVLLKSVVTSSTGEMESLFSILQFPFSVDRSESVTVVHFSCDEDFMVFEICGISHGLICLSSDKVIFLSNPSTREIRKLPLSILHPIEMAIGSVGFGYDAKSEDFKVVRFVYNVNLSSDKVIFLCNPSTREIRKLPPSILHRVDMEAAMEAVGFGCDAKSKDFKVVRIVYFVQGSEFWLLPRVEIYDLSKR